MSKTIRFINVSKRYNLGLTRTSLPSVISKLARRATGQLAEKTDEQKEIWALKDVTFELEKGKSLALIGDNGAGKTTTLKLLANITKPTSGNIEIKGRLSALIELGAGFHPDLTGGENIFLNGTILGLKHREVKERFDEIVAFSELERFIDTPIKRYSSGMKVRLGFAIAACMRPEILLVDEVLAVGDASFRQKSMNRIHELLEQGTSIIFVSHNLWLVQAVCEDAIYLEKGQVKHRGKSTEVIELYDRDINEARARKFDKERPAEVRNSTEIEIVGIDIVNHAGRPVSEFDNDEPATINIHYLANEELGNVSAVVRILRSDGLTACMMRTRQDEFPISIKRGKGTLAVTLDPLQLYGGSYYIQGIFRDKTDSLPLTSKSSDWFYVNGAVLSHQEMNGVFEPRRAWNHQVVPFTIEEIDRDVINVSTSS